MKTKDTSATLLVELHHPVADNLTSPAKEISQLTASGLLKIVLPGHKLSFTQKNTPQLLKLLKAVGRKDLSLGRLYEGHINALLLIHLYATKQQKEIWFADAERGCLFGVWNTGNQEPLAISPAEESTFVLSGKKTFASGAGLVKRALVTGSILEEEKKGWQMCIVNGDMLPIHAIDYTSWMPMGMENSISYTVDFTGYQVNTSELLGKANDYYQQPYFSAGAMRFCAVQLGGAEALFNKMLGYLKSLDRTEDVMQQTRIAEMATSLKACDLWVQQAGIYWDDWCFEPSKNDKLIAFVNMMRVEIERTCLRVIELSSKCIGARGLMQTNDMEKIVRDLQFYLRQPAPDAALTDVAKYVIRSQSTIEALWHEDKTLE